MNEPDRPVDFPPLEPGVNAGPNTACAETPVNGRLFLATALPVSLIFMLVSCFGCGTNAYEKKSADTEAPAAKSDESGGLHWPKVTVSRETTYFTGPLRSDGGVDYVAAFNKRLSEGVTPENNALIPLLQATGPSEIDKNIRKKYFEMLGIPELPEEGDYLIGFWDLPEYKEAEKQSGDPHFSQVIWEQHCEAVKTPWSAQDYPFWAAVFQRNEKLLDMVVEGMRRPKMYSPLVSDNEHTTLMGASFTAGYQPLRQIMRLLPARAMYKLHQGDVDGAWRDVMAQYRMQRLWSRQPCVTDRLILDVGYQFNSAKAVSQFDGLAAGQARECLRQFRGLPEMCPLKELCGNGERCSQIEFILAAANTANTSSKCIDDLFLCEQMFQRVQSVDLNPELKRRKDALVLLLAENNADWTGLLRRYNTWFDQIVEAVSTPQCSDGDAKLKTLEADTLRQANQTAEMVLSKTPEDLTKLNPEIKTQYIAELVEMPSLVHSWRLMCWIELRRQARGNLLMLAFALAGYRAEHAGQYPKTLGELVPNHIDAIPKDPFIDGDFHYRTEDGGYLLYSVGHNGKDDEGRGRDDYPESVPFDQRTEWDDISIRAPQKTN